MCDHVGVNVVGKPLGRDGRYFGISFIMLEFLGFAWSVSKK